MPTTSKTKAIETALDPAAKKAAMVVYAETHSRPVQSGNANQTTAPGVVRTSIEPTPMRRVPLEWLTGVASLDRLRGALRRSRHRGSFSSTTAQGFLTRGRPGPNAHRPALGCHALFGCHPARPLDHLNDAGLL